MKILSHNFSNALHFIFNGWREVFVRLGHEWRYTKPNEAVLDVFNEYEPDLYIGTTYDLTTAHLKAFKARPNLKVILKGNNYGPCQEYIDPKKYPIGMVSQSEIDLVNKVKQETGKPNLIFNFYHINRYPETMSYWKDKLGIDLVEGLPAADTFNHKPLGFIDESLQCDVAFVGGYWPYKAINLDRYIFPLCYPVGKYNVKIFGNSDWPVPQYLGYTDNTTIERLFASATVCPNISEPHANDFGFEVNERIFKLAASKAFCINDKIDSLEKDIFTNGELVIADDPDHFQDLVHMFVINPQLREEHIEACYNTVIANHTYCHRVSSVLNALGMLEEGKKALELLK